MKSFFNSGFQVVSVILKTIRGLEKVVAARVLEIFPDAQVTVNPGGAEGIVLVSNVGAFNAAEAISKRVPEVEKILPVVAESEARPHEIAEHAVLAARKYIEPGESFAVRTTRRGKHDFTSIDVNIIVGAKIKEELGNPVNLDYPDKVVWIEIFGPEAYISITPEQAMKKPKEDLALRISQKISIIQMPYLGDLEGAYRMGVRIGRAAQTFEVRELVIAPIKPCNAEEFMSFLRGVLEGRASRYEIQKKSYSRKVRLVPIKIQDMFQLVRSRFGEVFITTSARGTPINKELCLQIKEILTKENRVNVFIGSREGIPTGIMRWSKITINLCPGITFATEHGIPATITALLTCYSMEK